MILNRLKKRMTKVRILFMIKLTMGYFNVTSRHRMTNTGNKKTTVKTVVLCYF